ncbi:mannosyltransferase [Vermiconidia calcicola]|uniref:Mannosyltransferase n=1 Tax=Vermiconidia calcicola TaxID=1690605 RepID=A0ACC3NZP3_9PEZI|nr:mannosyltransferase [Vermiconidia calcicola]
MPESWPDQLLQTLLTLAVILSTALTIFIITLPSSYSHFQSGEITEEDFTEDDRQHAERSGYAYYHNHRDPDGKLKTECTIEIVVLGDIGRSPRMQYHALSVASHGGRVDLIGYVESDVHPDVQRSRFINVVPIKPHPKQLQASNRILFLLVAPLKVLWQVLSLYYALGYQTKASKWMLVQNPPSIPTVAVAQFVCFFRKTRLVIDWHNFGYSILAMRLGTRHPLVTLAKWYEGFFSRGATAHFAVTNAMARVLKEEWGVEALALHDRPPNHFQPLTSSQRSVFLASLPDTAQYAANIEDGSWRLIVSSTSWTADEDFALLLDALVDYSVRAAENERLPKILAIITGKGPLKEYYLNRTQHLERQGRLQNVCITTTWLSTADYASLLGSADLGISLHTSSSGVDLPMKVVDMFGTGLPVVGWSKFEAWTELVQEGKNGCGFDSAEGLTQLLQDLLGDDGQRLQTLRQGALEECNRRWDDEWMPVAGQLFQLKP